jgi:hypothetical protein
MDIAELTFRAAVQWASLSLQRTYIHWNSHTPHRCMYYHSVVMLRWWWLWLIVSVNKYEYSITSPASTAKFGLWGSFLPPAKHSLIPPQQFRTSNEYPFFGYIIHNLYRWECSKLKLPHETVQLQGVETLPCASSRVPLARWVAPGKGPFPGLRGA